jgi:hypothetical protein
MYVCAAAQAIATQLDSNPETPHPTPVPKHRVVFSSVRARQNSRKRTSHPGPKRSGFSERPSSTVFPKPDTDRERGRDGAKEGESGRERGAEKEGGGGDRLSHPGSTVFPEPYTTTLKSGNSSPENPYESVFPTPHTTTLQSGNPSLKKIVWWLRARRGLIVHPNP